MLRVMILEYLSHAVTFCEYSCFNLVFRFGRRIPNFVCMIVGGVFCLIVLAVPASKCWYNYRGGGGGREGKFSKGPPPP